MQNIQILFLEIKRLIHIFCIAFLLLFMNIALSFSDDPGLHQIIIDHPTTYENVTLDLKNFSFLITNNASLTIHNCIIKGCISPSNPVLFDILAGNMILDDSSILVDSSKIIGNPVVVSPYMVIRVHQGNVSLRRNQFSVDVPYTVGVLNANFNATSDFTIEDNYFYQFHGGIFLTNSKNALIHNNSFVKISGSNIYINGGNNTNIVSNSLLFSGNNNVGDAIDILDSDSTLITDNYILNDSCYAIFISHANNLTLDRNHVTGGITYAIHIVPEVVPDSDNNRYLLSLIRNKQHSSNVYYNANITITNNYFSQNRFGISASYLQNFNVKNNIFIQKFKTAKDRQFWTNNDILLTEISDLSWENNLYKEAYSQTNGGNNSLALKFVVFPAHGGVVL